MFFVTIQVEAPNPKGVCDLLDDVTGGVNDGNRTGWRTTAKNSMGLGRKARILALDLNRFVTNRPRTPHTVPFRPTVQSRVTICSELNTSGVSSRVTGYREQLPKQINRKYDFALILSAHSSTI